ncbi:hypothetical protein HZB08_01615 [Candidatus Saganbacteria bacterium]|uniref:Lipoprotein n=1 Tax=Candidatus Saganbacteria bacterium TaxID=2575572 RepID=A0A9D6UN63_UNCSA|nr:hypothetical protein [Candidatus Saganbacteria bacterium]
MGRKFIPGLLTVVFLSSCSSYKEKPAVRERVTEEVSSEAGSSPAPSSGEAVFVYGNPDKIILTLGGEALLLPSGYARLAGVVKGEEWSACLEIGGREQAVAVGEVIDGYRIKSISGKNMDLCRLKN